MSDYSLVRTRENTHASVTVVHACPTWSSQQWKRTREPRCRNGPTVAVLKYDRSPSTSAVGWRRPRPGKRMLSVNSEQRDAGHCGSANSRRATRTTTSPERDGVPRCRRDTGDAATEPVLAGRQRARAAVLPYARAEHRPLRHLHTVTRARGRFSSRVLPLNALGQVSWFSIADD